MSRYATPKEFHSLENEKNNIRDTWNKSIFITSDLYNKEKMRKYKSIKQYVSSSNN